MKHFKHNWKRQFFFQDREEFDKACLQRRSKRWLRHYKKKETVEEALSGVFRQVSIFNFKIDTSALVECTRKYVCDGPLTGEVE